MQEDTQRFLCRWFVQILYAHAIFFGFLSFYCGNLVPKVLFGKQVFSIFLACLYSRTIFHILFCFKEHFSQACT